MAKSRMCNMDGSTKKNHAEIWGNITLSYLQSQCDCMLRLMRALEKVKEGKIKYQDWYRYVNCFILFIKRPLINNAINFFFQNCK